MQTELKHTKIKENAGTDYLRFRYQLGSVDVLRRLYLPLMKLFSSFSEREGLSLWDLFCKGFVYFLAKL
jgi:hypothetical protein